MRRRSRTSTRSRSRRPRLSSTPSGPRSGSATCASPLSVSRSWTGRRGRSRRPTAIAGRIVIASPSSTMIASACWRRSRPRFRRAAEGAALLETARGRGDRERAARGEPRPGDRRLARRPARPQRRGDARVLGMPRVALLVERRPGAPAWSSRLVWLRRGEDEDGRDRDLHARTRPRVGAFHPRRQARVVVAPIRLEGQQGRGTAASRSATAISTSATSRCSSGSRTRPSRDRERRALSRASSAPSSRPSRRSRTRSRRTTSTRRHTRAGSPTCAARRARAAARPRGDEAPRARRALPRHRQDRHPVRDPAAAGPLTAEEFELVKEHPVLGEKILAPIERLADVRPIVRSCHERWDGPGYPDGKRGEEIPLESRIVFVCDAFHAMTTDRPYRKRLSEAEAVSRLREGAGSQFDPAVVETSRGSTRRATSCCSTEVAGPPAGRSRRRPRTRAASGSDTTCPGSPA